MNSDIDAIRYPDSSSVKKQINLFILLFLTQCLQNIHSADISKGEGCLPLNLQKKGSTLSPSLYTCRRTAKPRWGLIFRQLYL